MEVQVACWLIRELVRLRKTKNHHFFTKLVSEAEFVGRATVEDLSEEGRRMMGFALS